MRVKHLWSSRIGRRGIGKWSLLAAVVVVAIAATVAFTSTGSSSAKPAEQAGLSQTDSAHVLNPAPHQMAQLNFLLGSFRCLTPPVPGVGRLTMYETTSKILDGNYYQMIIKIPLSGTVALGGYWIFGWDALDHNYTAQYFDNMGTMGTTTSPGWQNGHFKFTGQYIDVLKAGGVSGLGKGWHITSQDDLAITGPGRYSDSSTYVQGGHWKSAGVTDCQKIT